MIIRPPKNNTRSIHNVDSTLATSIASVLRYDNEYDAAAAAAAAAAANSWRSDSSAASDAATVLAAAAVVVDAYSMGLFLWLRLGTVPPDRLSAHPPALKDQAKRKKPLDLMRLEYVMRESLRCLEWRTTYSSGCNGSGPFL